MAGVKLAGLSMSVIVRLPLATTTPSSVTLPVATPPMTAASLVPLIVIVTVVVEPSSSAMLITSVTTWPCAMGSARASSV